MSAARLLPAAQLCAGAPSAGHPRLCGQRLEAGELIFGKAALHGQASSPRSAPRDASPDHLSPATSSQLGSSSSAGRIQPTPPRVEVAGGWLWSGRLVIRATTPRSLPSARYPGAARRSLERFSTVSSITSRLIHASGILYSEDAPHTAIPSFSRKRVSSVSEVCRCTTKALGAELSQNSNDR